MFKQNTLFYSLSLSLIIILSILFLHKINYTYEAKHNFKIFKELSSSFLMNKQILIDTLDLEDKDNIQIQYKDNSLIITLSNNDYRKCLKYSIDYIESNFNSIEINQSLFTRKNFITREIILDKCNKKLNTITLIQNMEKK